MIDYRVDRRATMARGVIPGAFTVIREYAVIEAGAQIGAGCYIAPYVTIGKGADIGPHAVILAHVPAGAFVGAAAVWDDESAKIAVEEVAPGEYQPARRGRPKKAVRP